MLYLSLGYHVVFKVVRLKKERVNCCLPHSRCLSHHANLGALHDKTKGRL